jgi:UV DNA damage endonuclease
VGKIGFACKWIDNKDQVDGIGPKDSAKQYSTGITTISWLDRQTTLVAEERLYKLVVSNLRATLLLVKKVGGLPLGQRMVRLSSDILPAYSHSKYSYFYKQKDVISTVERGLSLIGDEARFLGVRLSFHPGQFTVLASANPGIVENSILEFEYHADMARMMGYGKSFQDFKINVHISGRGGPDGIKAAFKRLSTVAQNCITIENDEMTWGIDASIELSKTCALVLDLHHHFIKTGEYISPKDDRVNRIIDSWRGVQPVLHYSYSRDEHLPKDFQHTEFLNMESLLGDGHKKQKLRAHSDFYRNALVNSWALGFLEHFDIMAESKGKNLASTELYEASLV